MITVECCIRTQERHYAVFEYLCQIRLVDDLERGGKPVRHRMAGHRRECLAHVVGIAAVEPLYPPHLARLVEKASTDDLAIFGPCRPTGQGVVKRDDALPRTEQCRKPVAQDLRRIDIGRRRVGIVEIQPRHVV